MISYEQAREIVLARYQHGRHDGFGTRCLDDREIVESDEFFAFSVGYREYLVDGDFSYAIAGGVPVVYKADGRFGSLPSPEVAMDDTIRIRPNPQPLLKV
ncbi:hypothetical protein [Nocardia ignorata]|uniref:Immunity protein 35 of polymorphic toxin system n=1 Tax=Nocardia ignorata TaxID=145285 RepID=A0A4R6PKE5_NOCIG|nr:hypothetical protein [Nocardia ignorata]TDP38425.1 hypothetical protein DFR75_10380 [Nocardia ignorata]